MLDGLTDGSCESNDEGFVVVISLGMIVGD